MKSIEIQQHYMDESLTHAKQFNEVVMHQEEDILDIVSGIVQGAESPLMLSHAGLVLTPRVWSEDVKDSLATIANGARAGLKKIANYLAVSPDDLAGGIRKNMLGGEHLELFEDTLKQEMAAGISHSPHEVGRADIINGGAIEVNAACLDAPVDFHDLMTFHQQFMQSLAKNHFVPELNAVPEESIVELIVSTMVEQAKKNYSGEKPILAWIGSAAEVYGDRSNGGYWPRELRFKEAANAYLSKIGYDAEFQLVCVEQLDNPNLVSKIGSAYRNLLPEDMNCQSGAAIAGLCTLSKKGRLVGSITAELLTNKAAIAVITSPELSAKAGIGKSEWEYYARVFPPTAFLSGTSMWWGDKLADIPKLLEHSRDKLFFKLSNGEEGRGVWPGELVDDQKLQSFLDLTAKDPYAVLIQKKLTHFPFEVTVIDLGKYTLSHLTGETDAGTHYQLVDGSFMKNSGSNIVMSRFAPKNGASVMSNSGADGVFRPVATYIAK